MPNPCNEELENLLMREHPDLSKQQAEEILVLMNMRDEDIDLSTSQRSIFQKAFADCFTGPVVGTRGFACYFCRPRAPQARAENDLVNETLAKAVRSWRSRRL